MPDHSFEQLIAEHDEIERLISLMLVEACDTTVAPLQLVRSLNRLSDFVRDHLSQEDSSLYGTTLRLMGSHDDAAHLERTFEALKFDWLGYLSEWSYAKVQNDPAGFCVATEEILPRIRQRVSTETQLLYANALRTGIIRLRR